MSATITFIGGEGDGNVASTSWEDSMHKYRVDFRIGQPVLIEPEKERNVQKRAFLDHIIKKAKGNPFFKVEESARAGLRALAPSFETEAAPMDAERDFLVKEAESLGIKVDGRWSLETLKTEISSAKIAKAG